MKGHVIKKTTGSNANDSWKISTPLSCGGSGCPRAIEWSRASPVLPEALATISIRTLEREWRMLGIQEISWTFFCLQYFKKLFCLGLLKQGSCPSCSHSYFAQVISSK